MFPRREEITVTTMLNWRCALLPLVLVPALMLAGCGKEKPVAVAPPAAQVGVITVKLQDVPLIYEFVGQTESSQQVEIRARVNGFLDQRVYTEGSLVKAGQVMFVMDRKPFQAALDAAQAELAQQQARLTTARKNLARVKPLAERNALSQKDLDDSTGQEQAAAAAVEQARADVTTARLNLGYTTISSPVAGLSSFAKRQPGTYIDPTTSLLTYVAKLDPMRVNFSLSENEVLAIQAGEKDGTLVAPPKGAFQVVVILADGTQFPNYGHIAFADASFNSETGTYLVRAEVSNPNGVLRPGQFVRVKVLGAKRPNAVAVPQEAVIQGQRGQFVWVVGPDNKAQQRVVEVGEWTGNSWVIRSGLKPGEKVVVTGALRLAPGVPVKASDVPAPGLPTEAEQARPRPSLDGSTPPPAAPEGGAAPGGGAPAGASSAPAAGGSKP